MPRCSTLKTTISLGSCPIALLSISNICIAGTTAITSKMPYFDTLVAFLGARAIVVKMADRRQMRVVICEEIDGTWAWVAPGPERQPDATAGVPETAEDALVADESALAIPAPMQAPQPPPPAVELTRTITQRLARVEEDVHEI
ncbi:hypothetical protein Tco_0024877 [Tanacetum coccineum]